MIQLAFSRLIPTLCVDLTAVQVKDWWVKSQLKPRLLRLFVYIVRTRLLETADIS